MSNQSIPENPNTRNRSPAYPTTNLKDALDKVKVIWDADQRNELTLTSMAQHWEYNPKSSSAAQLAAALRKFGLIEHGTKVGSWRVSDFAIRILTNEDASSPERISLLKTAALGPSIYKDLWEKYAGNLPSDITIKDHLIADLHFNKKVVDKLIKDFRATITFANLTKNDKVEAGDESHGEMITSPTKDQPLTLPPKPETKEMRFELDSGPATVRYPMSGDDFELLIESLNLWKKKLIRPDQKPTS